MAIYPTATYCFSCGTYKKRDGLSLLPKVYTIGKEPKGTYLKELPKGNISNIYNNTIGTTLKDTTLSMSDNFCFAQWRGISADTMKFYDVKTRVTNGSPDLIVFPYGEGSWKQRSLDKKDFRAVGEMKDAPLFGMNKFNAGSAKSITITEGETDCLSVFQMLGSKYPCVSLPNGAAAAKASVERCYDYVNSFERIYLCFDNDDPGREATKQVAMLFDLNKVYIVNLTKLKDANEYLQKGADKEFVSSWWNAKRFRPKGVVSSFEEIGSLLSTASEPTIASYPFPTLDKLTYGIRSSELILFTAQEKIGKTEVLGAIEYSLLKQTDFNIGIIHLEESEKRSVQRLVGYELAAPVHLPDASYSNSDQMAAYQRVVRRDDRAYYYTHFGSDDPDSILEVVRYLVAVNKCKFIFLDHITMLVTGFEGDDERKKLDYLSTRLAMMTRELGFTLFLVSHVNDEGKTRGSRNIPKVADLIVHLDRDIESADEIKRNTTTMLIKGNRFAGTTGPAGELFFDRKTYKITELDKTTYENVEEKAKLVDFTPLH